MTRISTQQGLPSLKLRSEHLSDSLNTMEDQLDLVMADDGDHIQESNSSYAKKEEKEKQLRHKINMYLENKNNETEKAESKTEIRKNNAPRKPCNHFNDFGTCKYETGHFSKTGDICLIHVCRFCHDSSGKKELHPAALCAQLKTQGVLQDLGVPLKLADLNKDLVEKGTDKEIGEEIAAKLFEPKVDMIVGVVEVIGRKAAAENFRKTQKVESAGGMMVFNGTRRRTSGGTFLQLLRENTNIDQDKIATFLNKLNGVQVAKLMKKKEVFSLQNQSSLQNQCNPILNSRKPGDTSPKQWAGMKARPHVMVIPPINERMHEINARSVYIPKQRTVSRPAGDVINNTTPRSRLVQAEQGDYYGKSTAKSRLSQSMENYMGNVGSRRETVKKKETFSYAGRTQGAGESRSRYRGSQGDDTTWKDSKLDSRKASIDQIIGCLNQQRTDPIKNKLSQGKGTSVKWTEERNPTITSNSFSNEPWLAAYHEAKLKAVENLSGNLQSVSGISGYCGQVTNVNHLSNSSSQIGKMISKMKMEGRNDTENSYGGANRQGVIESKCGSIKTSLNPKAVPFNPSKGLFDPKTPPPGINGPSKSAHTIGSQESAVELCKEMKGSKAQTDRSHKKQENLASDKIKTQANLSQGRKSRTRLEEVTKKVNVSSNKFKSGVAGQSTERKKNHCPCPPYCPSCLENIKTGI